MQLYDELVARGLIAQVTDENEIKEMSLIDDSRNPHRVQDIIHSLRADPAHLFPYVAGSAVKGMVSPLLQRIRQFFLHHVKGNQLLYTQKF